MGKTEGIDRTLDRGGDGLPPRGRKSRRRDVDRLLEEGTLERVRLVEEREHAEPPGCHEPLDRHLDPGNVALDQERARLLPALRREPRAPQQRRDPPESRDQLGLVVRPDHAAARGEEQRLEDARIRHAARDLLRIVRDREALEARGREPGAGERLARRELAARSSHRSHRRVRDAPLNSPIAGARRDRGAVGRLWSMARSFPNGGIPKARRSPGCARQARTPPSDSSRCACPWSASPR